MVVCVYLYVNRTFFFYESRLYESFSSIPFVNRRLRSRGLLTRWGKGDEGAFHFGSKVLRDRVEGEARGEAPKEGRGLR